MMDKKTMMEKIAREAYERDSFTGAWLYAENGKIIRMALILKLLEMEVV